MDPMGFETKLVTWDKSLGAGNAFTSIQRASNRATAAAAAQWPQGPQGKLLDHLALSYMWYYKRKQFNICI